MSKGLENPYNSLPKVKRTTTSITVSDADRAVLFAICPYSDVLQVTLITLLRKYVDALAVEGITTYNPERFKEFLTSCTITTNNKKPVEEKNETNKTANPSPARGGKRPEKRV